MKILCNHFLNHNYSMVFLKFDLNPNGLFNLILLCKGKIQVYFEQKQDLQSSVPKLA